MYRQSFSYFLAALSLTWFFPYLSAQAEQDSSAVVRKEVAVMFDDLPLESSELENSNTGSLLVERLIASIHANEVPIVGFVNEGKLYRQGQIDPRRMSLLTSWAEAGFELGNHTYSHIAVNNVTTDAFEADVVSGETITRSLLQKRGLQLRFFRYPFEQLGADASRRAEVAAFLSQRGYEVVPTTVNSGDWLFAAAYVKARELNDAKTMQQVATAYVIHVEFTFEYAEGLARDLYGRNIIQTLPLHANSLNADHLGDLARMLRQRGYAFVTVERALSDPAFEARVPDNGRDEVTWLQRQALAAGLRPGREPQVPQFVLRLAGPSKIGAY